MRTDISQDLSRFLNAPERPEGTLNYNEARGFIFAIACSPELIRPSEWLPMIFNDQDADYASMEEAESVLQALIDLSNEVNFSVVRGDIALPDDISMSSPAMKNVGEAAALGQWSRGFFMAHDWLVELWHHYTPEALDEELGSSLMVLSFFSSRELAEAFYRETNHSSGRSLDEFADLLLGMFEAAMRSYAHLGRSIQDALEDEAMPQVPVKKAETIGRNDPCPCGSGKKYKKCCLH